MTSVARVSEMSTQPELGLIPSVAQAREAEAQCLRDRAAYLDDAGPVDTAALARTFDHPTMHELHAQERSRVDGVAEYLALVLFGVSTRVRLTPEQQQRIDSAAQYALRRPFLVWTRQAHQQAENTLVDAFRQEIPFFAQLPAEKRRELAVIVTRLVWAAFIGTLEGTTPSTPANYLRAAAEITLEGGR